MSRMFSSKSSGGWVVVVRLAMSAIVPPATVNLCLTAPRGAGGARAPALASRQLRGPVPPRGESWGGSGSGEATVHADELAGDVAAGGAGQEDGDALEVGGVAVAADHGAGGEGGRAGRVAGHLAGERGGDEAGCDGVAAHAP